MSFYDQGLLVGAESPPTKEKKGGTLAIVIILIMTAAVYGLSPGARHYYKHGRLPD